MKKSISLLCIVLLIFVFSSSTQAQKHVKIATIGAVSPLLDKSQKPQKLVDQMIEFWSKELLQVLPDKPDLIVLPETCDLPRDLTTEEQVTYFKVRKNQVLDYFRDVAKENHCYIALGMKHQLKDGTWRNSAFLLDRSGNTVGIYDKNFPTIGEMEDGIIAGKETPIFQCDFGSVAFAICFDLNFDELRLRYVEKKPDIIIFPSMYHGGLAQANWAYSCRSYFVGSIGIRNLPSEIRNPMGKVIASSTNYFHFTSQVINLDYCLAHLDNNLDKLKEMKKKYGKEVTISDPGEIGSVILTSEHKTISIEQMVKEFEITLLDDYLNDSRKFKQNH